MPSTWNSLFEFKCVPYSMISTKQFVKHNPKPNIKSFNIVIIALNIWNFVSNAMKSIPLYVSYKEYILKQCF